MLTVSGNRLTFENRRYPCAVGKSGLIPAAEKREGDGCTPVGTWRLRECWYRADRIEAPETGLPLRIITPEDGWCDDSGHPLYNRHFLIPSPSRGEGQGRGAGEETCEALRACTPTPTLPPEGGGSLPASFERLWREDHAYDLIVPLGYNDDPVIPGKGSAIFLHCAHADYRGTEGCVALARKDLLEILKSVDRDACLVIRE